MSVTTQVELDAALAAGEDSIFIDSPSGVWLTINDSGSSRVVARDSARVVAWGSSHVVARDTSHVEASGSSRVVARDTSHVEASGSSRVEAWGSSHVDAWGSSHVEAWGSSHVDAWGSSRVVARDSARVVAWGSSHVEASGSSHVEASGSSRVEASGSSHVEASGSSHVEAWGSSHVDARDSSHVEASPYVAVHLWSQKVTLNGGVVIDLTSLDLSDRDQWLNYHGVQRDGQTATLYKAVDDDYTAGHAYQPTQYPVGETITAPDWRDDAECGHGLHFGLTAAAAQTYFPAATRFLKCEVPADQLVPLGDKAKAPWCRVVAEVDLHGNGVKA